MADKKITQFTADTAPAKEDILVTAKSPFGAASNRKVSIQSLFTDSNTVFYNAADSTKTMDFSLAGITTGTKRTLTMADADVDLGNVASAASAANNGYLSSTDWSDFDSKEAGLGDPAADGHVLSSTTAGVRSWVDKQDPLTINALTESTSSVLTITDASVVGAAPTITVAQSSGTTDGYLSSTDWSTFNNKQDALTTNALTEATSDILTITDTAAIGAAPTIQVKKATALQSGYLDSADFSTFNGKQDALTFGIADTNSVVVNDISVTAGEYARWTATGLEGRSAAEVKTDLSLDNVENTALTTWAGSTSITTLGTIATGTWNGTAIDDTYISSATDWNNKEDGLGNPSADGQVLSSTIAGVRSWVDMSAVTSSFSDNDFELFNEVDNTKKAVFDTSNVATSATRTITVPDSDVDLGDIAGKEDGLGNPVTDGHVLSSTALGARSWVAKQDELTFGIADTNSVVVDDAAVATGEYARWTANGIEGRSAADVKSDLSLDNVENTALTTWAGSTNITTLGTIATGTWNGTAIADAYIASSGTWDAKEDGLGNPASNGQVLASQTDGTRSWTDLPTVPTKATGADLDTGTDDDKFATAKALTDSNLTNKKIALNSQADAYTLALSDAGKMVIVTNADAKTLTVPKNSVAAFEVGTKIAVMQGGAGLVTIAPVDGDVTLKSFESALSLAGENAGCVLIKIDTDTWLVEGNLITS